MASKKLNSREICEVYSLLEILGRKWTFPIMLTIKNEGETNFSEIDRMTNHSISPRALSRSLKDLVQMKIIKKEKYGRAVIYKFTDNGKKLINVMKMLRAWCSMNDIFRSSNCDLKCIRCKYLKNR
jgi:DNA-binding HxlR family transcriptional regulator